MKIVNKQQMLSLPNGTVFCEFIPCFFEGQIYVKCGYYEDEGKPSMNGAVPLYPFFTNEDNWHDGSPSLTRRYSTQTDSTDVSGADYDDDDLFAIFSKDEVLRMIGILSWSLVADETELPYDEDILLK